MDIYYDEMSVLNNVNVYESFVNFIKKVRTQNSVCNMM